MMQAYQNIHLEVDAIESLNRFLVINVYDRIVNIDSRIVGYIQGMAESGIPVEFCSKFREDYYKNNHQLFKGIYASISESHIQAIKMYLEQLSRQYYAAKGFAFDIGTILRYPDSAHISNVATSITTRNNAVNDYAIQCEAVCDFADFLVKQTEDLDLVLLGYSNCCNDLLRCGVPSQICNHYNSNFAEPLVKTIKYDLREALFDDYNYIIGMYNQLCESMTVLGISVPRTPMSMPNLGNDCLRNGGLQSGNNNQHSFVVLDNNEQQSNYMGLANVLKIKLGRPMTVAEADKQNANPHYWDSVDFKVNCATCANAYAIRRLGGLDVKAKGNNRDDIENLNHWLSFDTNSFLIWKNSDGTPAKPVLLLDWMGDNYIGEMNQNDYERFFNEQCNQKGTYLFLLTWDKNVGYGGHATILERDENGLHWIEPQRYDKEITDDDGKRPIGDLIEKLSMHPSSNAGVMRLNGLIFDAEEKTFFISKEVEYYTDTNGVKRPKPFKLVPDGYKNDNGEVRKMSFAVLFEV